MNLILKLIKGFAIGFLNSFLGSGGGIIAVPMFKNEGKSQNSAHANAIALTMLLTLISSFLYIHTGKIDIFDAAQYIPMGIIGSFLGAIFMPKIPSKVLRKIFAAFMIWAGIRMIFK